MSYHAEHLAWQQRVAQELSRASQFQRTANPSHRRSLSSKTDSRNFQASRQSEASAHTGQTGYSYLSTISANPKLRQFFDENAYKNAKVNMGYSFGGRTHAVNAFKEASKQENPLLSRPSTSGSLRTRRTIKAIPIEVEDRAEVATPKSHRISGSATRKLRISGARSVSRGTHRSSRSWAKEQFNDLNSSILHSELVKDAYVTNDSPKDDGFQVEPVEIDEKQTNAELAGAELEDQVSDMESIRPPSAATWKTSSSQRRYIRELERLLIEERKRKEEILALLSHN